MWKCPKCSREFRNTNQPHSCRIYPLSEHFKGKEAAKELYDKLLNTIEKEIGAYKIESLECCIHVVDERTKITYFCIYPLKNGSLKLHISSDKALKGSKVGKGEKIAGKYKYEILVRNQKDIDKELIDWLKASNS